MTDFNSNYVADVTILPSTFVAPSMPPSFESTPEPTPAITIGSTETIKYTVPNIQYLNPDGTYTYVVEGTTEFDLKILYGNNDDAAAVASTDILAGSNTGANKLFFSIIYVTDP